MKLKLTNRLASLPNEVHIQRYEQVSMTLILYVSWDMDTNILCPSCRSNDIVRKGHTSTKLFYHVPVGSSPSVLSLSQQRLYCKHCGRYFTETPEWLHPSKHITTALYLRICRALQETTSIRKIAEELCIPEKTVSSVMLSVRFSLPPFLPEVLCIDEFKGDTGHWDSERSRFITHKFHCNISDGRSGFVVDILPRIDLEYLDHYIRQFTPSQRQHVRFFCTDMHGGFLSFAKRHFPNAIICVDMFHTVQLLNDNIDQIRRRLQNDMLDNAAVAERMGWSEKRKEAMDHYSLLKGASHILKTAYPNRSLLWKDHEERNLLRLNRIFALSDELKEAYVALQSFHRILRENAYSVQRALFDGFLDDYSHSEWEGMRHVAATFHRNKKYILNSWKYGHSNATCEGLNNKIKILKRNAYGQHSFENFRHRILFACGSPRFVQDSYTLKDIRRMDPDLTNDSSHKEVTE